MTETTTTPTLETSDAKRAAHLLGSFYVERAIEICRSEGISDADIKRGREIRDTIRYVDNVLCGIYGNPAYGSWPERAAVDRFEMLAKKGVFL